MLRRVGQSAPAAAGGARGCHAPAPVDLADAPGKAHARRAMEVAALDVAAASGQHLLLIGSLGSGKILLASHLPSQLPDTEESEALQLAAIALVSGEGLPPALVAAAAPRAAP